MKINSILILFSLALIAMTSCASQKSAAYAYDNGNGRSFQNSQADVVTEKKIIYSEKLENCSFLKLFLFCTMDI